METVLVTGAAGFIGGHIVEELAGSGYRVRATDLQVEGLPFAAGEDMEAVRADLTDAEAVDELVREVDYVVHCAAAFDLGLPLKTLLRVNLDGTRNLCEAAGRRRIRQLVLLSTGGVYGKTLYAPTREDHPHRPNEAYSLSKEAAEQAALHILRKEKVPLTVFRPTAVYGPRSRYVAGAFFVLPAILAHFGLRAPLMTGGQHLNWVHVRDVAGATRFCLGNPDAFDEDFNLADSDLLRGGDFFRMVMDLFGIGPLFSLPYPTRAVELIARLCVKLPGRLTVGMLSLCIGALWRRVVRTHGLRTELAPKFDRDFFYYLLGDHAYDNSKLRGIGYKFRYPRLEPGFRETIQWYREQRWLP